MDYRLDGTLASVGISAAGIAVETARVMAVISGSLVKIRQLNGGWMLFWPIDCLMLFSLAACSFWHIWMDDQETAVEPATWHLTDKILVRGLSNPCCRPIATSMYP